MHAHQEKSKEKKKEDVNVAIFPISFQQRIWDQTFLLRKQEEGGCYKQLDQSNY
jgi:hypothetical protein